MRVEMAYVLTGSTGAQLATSPIARGYRKLRGAIIVFAFVTQLAIGKVTSLGTYSEVYTEYNQLIQ